VLSVLEGEGNEPLVAKVVARGFTLRAVARQWSAYTEVMRPLWHKSYLRKQAEHVQDGTTTARPERLEVSGNTATPAMAVGAGTDRPAVTDRDG
jgi:hypothetical protein